jgi:hypothetical protein
MGAYGGVEPTWASQTNVGRTHIATKGVVQSGLVLNLDAGVSSSYPGSGTTWTNLVGGGNNGTLVNGVGYVGTNGGALSFDGVNDYTTLNNTIFLNYNKTFIFWLKFSGGSNGGHLLNINNSNFRNRVLLYPLGLNVYNSDSATEIEFNFSITDIVGKIKQIGFLVDDSSIYLIEDGVLSQETSITFPNGQRSYNHIGLQSAGSIIPFFNGNIYNFLHYNRALTPQEIQQNFNANRSRFGI